MRNDRVTALYDAAGADAYGLAFAVLGDAERAERSLVRGLSLVVADRDVVGPDAAEIRLMTAVCADLRLDADPVRRRAVATILAATLGFCRADVATILGVDQREADELIVAGLRDVRALPRSA